MGSLTASLGRNTRPTNTHALLHIPDNKPFLLACCSSRISLPIAKYRTKLIVPVPILAHRLTPSSATTGYLVSHHPTICLTFFPIHIVRLSFQADLNTVKLAATQIITRPPPSHHLDRPYSPPTPSLRTHQSSNVDISLLLKPKDARPGDGEEERGRSSSTSPAAKSTASLPSLPSLPSTIATSVTGSANPHSNPHITPSGPTAPPSRASPSPSNLRHQPQSLKRAASTAELPTASPAKKQSKWSPDEDAKIIQLRGEGMKWEDISKHLPGRSAISCRLHYQNYLERRSEWDEDRKNKLARLYERFKADMWSRIAEEMAIPWRAAEAMHWQMGEHEMARRAGVTPFTLANTNNHSQPQPNHSLGMARHYSQLPPSMMPSSHPHQHFRRNSNPSASLSHPLTHSLSQPGSQAAPGQTPQLPSLAELTAGLPAFAPQNHHHATSNPANGIEALSPYHEYPHRRSLPPGGLPSGTAFDHLPPPGSLSGYPRPGSPAAGGTPLGGPPNYFPTSAPAAREVNGRR